MKEIGEKFRLTREDIGIEKEEVCEDLKIDIKQLDKLEEGDINAFPDILSLKYLIRDYAKYLGLSKDDIMDEFNEFLFDYTSKISLDDIKQATKDTKKEELNKIQSPYTIERKVKIYNSQIIIYILICIVILLLGYFIFSMIKGEDKPINDVITFSDKIERKII